MKDTTYILRKIKQMRDIELARALRDIEMKTDKLFTEGKQGEKDYSEIEGALMEEICNRFVARFAV